MWSFGVIGPVTSPSDGSTVVRSARPEAAVRARAAFTASWVAVAVLLSGCTALGGSPSDRPGSADRPPAAGAQPSTTTDRDPAVVAERVAAALTNGATTSILGPDAQQDITAITAGMDEIEPQVDLTRVAEDGDRATADFTVGWPLPSGNWSYATSLELRRDGRGWVPVWAPSVLHPQLTATNRLVHRNEPAERGDILGAADQPLVKSREVMRLGLNKADVPTSQQQKSARALAALLDINVDAFADRTAAAGPQAFVEALTVRGDKSTLPGKFGDIQGAMAVPDTAELGPYRGFAEALLGQVGPATSKQVNDSRGALLPGDPTGQTGLQLRYNNILQGRPGGEVFIVSRTPTTSGSTPSPTAPSTSASAARQRVHAVKPVPGKDLKTTLSGSLQERAEKVLAGVRPAASIVALDPRTGAVLAAANSRGSKSYPTATIGRYAPGSTFKVVTSLALLRAGMTADSPVDCPRTITVNGRTFKNYNDFPTSRLGSMTLKHAIASSCNTALIGQHQKLSGPALREAAGSLGLGQDYDAGFPSFYGSVPDPANVVGLAESTIGQGKIEASPMAMAGVAASVANGDTTVPHLVADQRPRSDAITLTRDEAAQLQQMMGAVVSEGSGRFLQGQALGAKTGTAEYGTARPPRTHAWMIAYTDDLAVAVMVADGQSGSGTAGPLLKNFLS